MEGAIIKKIDSFISSIDKLLGDVSKRLLLSLKILNSNKIALHSFLYEMNGENYEADLVVYENWWRVEDNYDPDDNCSYFPLSIKIRSKDIKFHVLLGISLKKFKTKPLDFYETIVVTDKNAGFLPPNLFNKDYFMGITKGDIEKLANDLTDLSSVLIQEVSKLDDNLCRLDEVNRLIRTEDYGISFIPFGDSSFGEYYYELFFNIFLKNKFVKYIYISKVF